MSRTVLCLCEFPTLNGGEQSLLSVLPAVAAAGWRPIVAAPAQGDLAGALAAAGIEHVPLELRDAARVRQPLATARETLAGVLARTQPALVHANSLSMGRLSGPVTTTVSVPSISHLRDIVSLPAQHVADLNAHRRLVCVSAAVRAFHAAQGLEDSKLRVVYNGVDLERFRPGPPTGGLHRELGLPADAQLVLCVGQFILRKGQMVLAEAAERLAAECPRLHWVLVGERHSTKPETVAYAEEIAARFTSGALAGRGHLLGVRRDLAELMREPALLAHPALQEPLGRVLLEAAASGLAVVATAVGGTREIFGSNDSAALLVPPRDPGALAGAIRALVTDDSRRAALRAAARQQAEERFDVRQAGAGLLRVYDEAAG